MGSALLAYMDEGGSEAIHVVERDDGYIGTEPADLYFREADGWLPVEESAVDRVGGRVLDIGAGAGRFALELTERGHDVVALDVSAGCLEVCRRRGINTRFHGTVFDLATTNPEPFDTYLLMGHNLALLAGPEAAPRYLEALTAMARPGAKIIGTNRDPLATNDPNHLGYHQLNRDRGRHPGQMRLRVRWRHLATAWFDYWFLSIDELETIALAAGWRLSDHTADGASYLAELERIA